MFFLYLQLRGISECGGRQYTIKKKRAPRRASCVRALGMVKTRGDNLVSFTKVTVHLVPLILVPCTLKIQNNFVTYNISKYLT